MRLAYKGKQIVPLLSKSELKTLDARTQLGRAIGLMDEIDMLSPIDPLLKSGVAAVREKLVDLETAMVVVWGFCKRADEVIQPPLPFPEEGQTEEKAGKEQPVA